jgi:hypothetical protein
MIKFHYNSIVANLTSFVAKEKIKDIQEEQSHY